MNDSKKISLSDLKKEYRSGLCIPEIQRDYVMGAGGKDRDGKDKLEKLLNAILAKCRADEDFDFSCIITYCKDSENARLEIYDGQQRLTTLVIMILYKLRSEKKCVTEFDNWYRFMGRPKANEILGMLTDNESSIADIEVTDFTSFSMKNLLEKTALPEYEDITSGYLLERVKFDMVSIGSQNEIEQFFMDLNSGVKLKDYELYKAKLTHRVNQIKREHGAETKDEAFDMWSHKIDNEWLNFFAVFADYKHPAEEYEIAFVKYCMNMIFIEDGKAPVNGRVETITAGAIQRVYYLMQKITELDLNFFRHENEELLKKGILYFSWGECDSDIRKFYNYKLRGAFWNLAFEEYDKMLYYIMKFVLLDAKKSMEMKADVLLWCFITTLDWQIDMQNEYLRLIKIILNHNVTENGDAWYECQNKGQYLYYCKYSVYAIPQYYGEHLNTGVKDHNKNRHSNMFLLNKSVIQNAKTANILNRGKIAIRFMEQIRNISKGNDDAEHIIATRMLLLKMPEYNRYDDYVKRENAVFGIIGKITQPVEEKYYLEEVTFEWPTRGKRPSSLICQVRLKCRTDFLFAKFHPDNHDMVERTIRKMDREFIDKCFWMDQNTVGKLTDRASSYATTYNKKDSDSGWCEEYNI